jgi:hypothetical protein
LSTLKVKKQRENDMIKRKKIVLMAFIAAIIFSFTIASAQQTFIYPNQGQSPEQQSRDEFECQQWAKNQTGVDPHQLAQQQTNAPETQKRQVLGGAARGAAIGAVGGAIADSGDGAKKGAAIGAGVGATGGVIKKRQQEQQHVQSHEQANQQRKNLMDTYNRAYSACLEGRGYTVR